MIAVTRDVTQLRRSEADLLQARLAQDIARSAAALAARLGHDLKAPLDTIIGHGEMLLESAEEEARQGDADDLRRVLAAASELHAMLNQMLQTALTEARQDLSLSKVADLDDLIEATVEAAAPLPKARGAVIKLEIDGACATLQFEPDKLAACLQALLAHAIERTHDGIIAVKARRVLAAPSPFLALSVVDAGPGLSPEELAEIAGEETTSACAQSPPRVSRVAVAHKLARLLGGNITVASAASGGARITLKIPVQQEFPGRQGPAPPTQQVPR